MKKGVGEVEGVFIHLSIHSMIAGSVGFSPTTHLAVCRYLGSKT